MKEHDKEIMELGHKPVPGYRTAFYIIFGLSLIYLAVIFISGKMATQLAKTSEILPQTFYESINHG